MNSRSCDFIIIFWGGVSLIDLTVVAVVRSGSLGGGGVRLSAEQRSVCLPPHCFRHTRFYRVA